MHLPGCENRQADSLSRAHLDDSYFDLFLLDNKDMTETFIKDSFYEIKDSI